MDDDLATVPITLSKYEMARVVGVRLTMMQQGMVHDAGDSMPSIRAQVRRGDVPFSMRRGDEYVHAQNGETVAAERPRTPRSRPPATPGLR